jgi:hypothetical protein
MEALRKSVEGGNGGKAKPASEKPTAKKPG